MTEKDESKNLYKSDQLDPQTLNNTRRKLTVQIPTQRTEGARAMYDVSLSVTESVMDITAECRVLGWGAKARSVGIYIYIYISVMYIIITEDRSIFVGGRDRETNRGRNAIGHSCNTHTQHSLRFVEL